MTVPSCSLSACNRGLREDGFGEPPGVVLAADHRIADCELRKKNGLHVVTEESLDEAELIRR